MDNFFDLIVLGAGSGGLAAAKRAALHGAKVALVEGDRVGGTCVIRGCVPKKLLVYGSAYKQNLNFAKAYGFNLGSIDFKLEQLLENVQQEVSRLSSLHINSIEKLGIKKFSGWGRFQSRNCIAVSTLNADSKETLIKGKNILIAVGGEAIRPNIPGSDLAWISDDVFIQKSLPEHILIVGSGFIACEFACIFRGLGLKVTQVVRSSRLLKDFDSELAQFLEDSLLEKGVNMIFRDSVKSISGEVDALSVNTDNGKNFNCGAVLFAIGRKPCVMKLGLDAIGLNTENSRIIVDDNQLTSVSNVYAIGDVTDRINLTPVAIEEGRCFADTLFGNNPRTVDYSFVPKAVFSQPELASVGLTEQHAEELYGKDRLLIYKSKFRPMSKALPKKGDSCFLKLIVDSHTKVILGCHMVGENAAEIIQVCSIALSMRATKDDFDKTMALHPTIAEEFVTMT